MLRPRMRLWLSALILGGSIGSTSVASAQSFTFDWKAPDGCPSADAVRATTTGFLALSQDKTAVVRASGVVKRRGARWALQLTLDIDGQRATRELSAADCGTLSDAAAWLVALAIDPQVGARSSGFAGVAASD